MNPLLNDLLNNFHFLRPWGLLALLPAAALFVFLLQHQKRSSQWSKLIHPKLLPFLLDGELSRQQRWPLVALLLSWIIASLALAGPTWERKPQPVQKDQSSMVIVWDLSLSMMAQDIKPSRLVRARLKLDDLLEARKAGLTALIVYSGDAHVVTPLTDDVRTIKTLLPGLEPRMMPSNGSNPEAALELAHKLLKDSGVASGHIVFLTDGISPSAFANLEEQMKRSRHRVLVWGIGTPEGAPIPLPLGGFAKRQNGEIVIVKLDETQLSEAAVSMGGIYLPFTHSTEDIANLTSLTDSKAAEARLYEKESDEERASRANARLFDQWLERGYWLVLLLLPGAALAFRRGWLLACCLFGFVASPESQALEWKDLWQTKDQQAHALLEAGQADEAAKNFANPAWKGIAHFRAGDLASAEKQFSQSDSAADLYNLGNTLTFKGDYDQAIAAFDRALQQQPDFEQARHNRDIAKQLKQLAEQAQQNQQSGEQGEQGEQGEKSEQQDGEGQSSENPNQNGEGSENEQNQSSDGEQSNSQQASEEQQKALDKAYRQQQEAQQAKQNSAEQSAQSTEEQQEQAAQEATQQALQEPAEDANQTPEDAEEQAAYMQMTEAEREQQQALEQWLRRVPDDPSGLLRNKFNYEYQQRRREAQTRGYGSPYTTPSSPNSAPEDRW